MNIPDLNLPLTPTYDESCQIIDDYPDSYWNETLLHIQQKHQLSAGKWIRIREGGNALFLLNNELIIKIVPPNWKEQGTAEINTAKLLANKLSLPIPEMIASGEINNWIYVVMTRLSGISMADIWGELSVEEKLPVVKQLSNFINELHLLTVDNQSEMRKDWNEYKKLLINDCIPRHQRKNVPDFIVQQMTDYLVAVEAEYDDFFDDDKEFFIHMDLHPWNLMLDKVGDNYQISGVIDFGDAVIGRSRLLELVTPIIFVCQGSEVLVKSLISSYKLLEQDPGNEDLQRKLMAVTLLRPASDFNFVLKQVPITGARNTLDEIAQQLFPV